MPFSDASLLRVSIRPISKAVGLTTGAGVGEGAGTGAGVGETVVGGTTTIGGVGKAVISPVALLVVNCNLMKLQIGCQLKHPQSILPEVFENPTIKPDPSIRGVIYYGCRCIAQHIAIQQYFQILMYMQYYLQHSFHHKFSFDLLHLM